MLKKSLILTMLTGADTLARILKNAGIRYVYAYPGTSELMICDAVLKTEGLTLINGRGDKESAFMAAGGCLMKPNQSCAILHGARGLTNACGAIADAFRNEIGTLFIVGLPSTDSQSFLPPHGETDLIKNIGRFVKNYDEITDIKNPKIFVEKLHKIICKTKELPIGPVLIGIPQDAFEKKWVPVDLLNKKTKIVKMSLPYKKTNKATDIIKNKKNPLIIIDDYLFKNQKAKKELVNFSKSINAPILQLFYGRGPMIFERISVKQNPFFVGSYDPNNKYHQSLMEKCDLLITLEDRNIYPRVVGKLPNCQKIAITSNPKKTKKNRYLKTNDLLLSGNVSDIMFEISKRIGKINNQNTFLDRKTQAKIADFGEIDNSYIFLRKNIAKVLADIFQKIKNPVIVDDSQMFGGMLFRKYDIFPSKLRVFGDHGAFIGGGISYATGLAHVNKDLSVYCLLGDQAFINGLQGLVSAVENKVKCVYIVCNNGESVSLHKQAHSQNPHVFDNCQNKFLKNITDFSYQKIAKAIGLTTYKIKHSDNNPEILFEKTLKQAINIQGPVLIELQVPSNPRAWLGVWTVKGNEIHDSKS